MANRAADETYRPKDRNAAGRYVDNKIHVIPAEQLRQNLYRKPVRQLAGIAIKYRVLGDDDVAEVGVRTCDINEIKQQGVGADVFRCPVDDCDVAVVRRHCIERHIRLVHRNDPRMAGKTWKSHPTMSSFAYGQPRPNYSRRSAAQIALVDATSANAEAARRQERRATKQTRRLEQKRQKTVAHAAQGLLPAPASESFEDVCLQLNGGIPLDVSELVVPDFRYNPLLTFEGVAMCVEMDLDVEWEQ